MKIAVVTNVRHDSFFTKLWLDHYSALLGGREHCYIMLDGNDWTPEVDLSGANVSLMRRRVTGRGHSDIAATEAHNRMIKKLITQDGYDLVIRADVDELICLNPNAPGQFEDHTEKAFEYGYLYVNGLDIVHNTTQEAPYDPTRSILSQRHHALIWPYYFKPMIYTQKFFETEGLSMMAGNHRLYGGHVIISPEIYMLHLALFDHGFEQERSKPKLGRRRYEEYLKRRRSIFDSVANGTPIEGNLDAIVRDVREKVMYLPNGDIAQKPQFLGETNFATEYEFGAMNKVYARIDNRFDHIA